MKKWKILKNKIVYKNPWVKISQEICRLPNGQVIDYYIKIDNDVATIFCLTKDNQLVLNRQYKHGIKKTVLELPAGVAQANESILQTAKRELEEETGYIAKTYKLIAKLEVNPTSNQNYNYVFLARQAKLIGKKIENDPKEKIENIIVPLKQIPQLIKQNKISVQWSIAAIYKVFEYLDKINFKF